MKSNRYIFNAIRHALFAMILCLGSFAASASAQTRVENYIVESGNSFNWDYGDYIGWGYDDVMQMSLPFDFTYDGVVHKAGAPVYISTNGWVSFNDNFDYYDYGNIGNSNYPNTIYVLGMDLNVYDAVYWNESSSAVTIGWYYAVDNIYGWYWNYFSMTLTKSDNSISMAYYGNCWYMHPYGEQVAVGLNGNNGPDGFSYKIYSTDPWSPCENIKFREPKPDKPALTVSTTQLDFNALPLGTSQTMCFTVTNTGTAGEPGGAKNPLTFSPANITGSPTEFTITTSPTTSLDLGESAQYCVKFEPNQPNTRTSTMSIASSAGSSAVALSGRGVAAVLAADQQFLFRKTRTKVGYSRDESFWIRNTGGAPLTVTSVDISGEYPEQYSVVSTPTAIPGNDSGKITIRYSPRYEGLKTGIATVVTNGYGKNTHAVNLFGLGTLPRLTVTPANIGIDSVAMGDTAWYNVRLANVGSDTVTINQDYLSSFDKDFAYFGLGADQKRIAPDQFRDVKVRFVPTSRGTRLARIRITTDIPRTFDAPIRDTSEFEVNIRAVGVPYGLISVEGGSMLDSTRIGTSVCQMVKIWNNGLSALTVNSAVITGSNKDEFAINGASFPLTIEPMSFIEVQVCGTPSARGFRTANVAVNATSSDKTTTAVLPIAVFGQLVCAQPSATTLFDGSILRVGSSKTAQVIVNNCGDVPSSYTATVAGAGYSIVGSATSGMIAPGANHTFEVSFAASAIAQQPGTLTITSADVPTMTIDLAGTGGNSILTASNTNAGATSSSVDFDVVVTNAGNMDWTVGTPSVTAGEFTLKTNPTSIAALSTGIFTFTFTPVDGGSRMATVTFPTSDNTTFQFSINGAQSSVSVTAMNGYELRQNYPNPFNATSAIIFTMAEAGNATIVVSDITGNVVATVANGFFGEGENSVNFDASNLPSGSYYYELVAGSTRLQRSMILSK